MVASILREIRFASRRLVHNPLFTLVAVLILALGIGSNSAIFSFVNGVLLQPLNYRDSERLVQLWEYHGPTEERLRVSTQNFMDWESRTQAFEVLGAYWIYGGNLWGGEEPERVSLGIATAGYFKALRIEPLYGRLFTPEDQEWGKHRVAVISYSLWQRRFGGDPDILGDTISLEGFSYEVIGILPADFQHPEPSGADTAEMWRPLSIPPGTANRTERWLQVFGRLNDGVSLEQAHTDMDRIARALEEEFPDVNAHRGIDLVPLHEFVVGDLRSELSFLLLAVGLVLLIVCANLSSLMTVRSEARSKETALRIALGAGRRELLRQQLIESLLLTVLGAVFGLLFAKWVSGALSASASWQIPRLSEIGIDTTVIGFTGLVSAIAILIFGVLPILGMGNPNLASALKEGGRSAAAGARSHKIQRWLVIAEVATTFMLVVGAGLLFSSYRHVLSTDPGFQPQGVLTTYLALPFSKYREVPQRNQFWESVIQRTAELPGVSAAGAVDVLALTQDRAPTPYLVEGQEPPPAGEEPLAELRLITPGYLSAMGVSLLAGRDFRPDDRDDGLEVAMVNKTLAERWWPGEPALGKRLRLVDFDDSPWVSIVGVIADMRQFSLDTEPTAEIYRPVSQRSSLTMNLVLRTQVEPTTLTEAVRREVQKIDPDQPLFQIRTMAELYDRSLSRRRFLLSLLAGFAVTALILAAIGLYGVMAFSVVRRTQEIGLRMALGAPRSAVMKQILKQAMVLFLSGLAIGLPLTVLLNRFMSGLIYGVRGYDPLTLTAAVVMIAVMVFLASFVPALRATRVDPLVALRHE